MTALKKDLLVFSFILIDIVQHAAILQAAHMQHARNNFFKKYKLKIKAKGPLTWVFRDRPIPGSNPGRKIDKASVLALRQPS